MSASIEAKTTPRRDTSGVFIEESPDIFLRLDKQLRVTQACGALASAGDPDPGRWRGKPVGTLFGEQGSLLASHLANVQRTGVEERLALELGMPPQVRHFLMRAFVDGGSRALLLVGRDTTDQVRAEQALARSERQCAELLERERALGREADERILAAERASRMKDEFLATLSHELRTPLNTILGWTQMVKSDDTPKDTLHRALSQIEQSAQAQAKLVDDLLHIAEIVAGRLRIEVQPMRLARSINAVIEALHPALDAKAIRLETSFDLAADIVRGDPARIQQVLWNLVSNAVKFTPPGGLVRIALSQHEGGALIVVSDSGEGIDPAFLPYVFDRFRQGDASSRKRHGGLGLGLAIARYLVEQHGGRIEARSAGEGCGAEFSVLLPLSGLISETQLPRVSNPNQDRSALAVPLAGRPSLRGLRILTVDDDRNTREMLSEALSHAGAEVMTAESADDALKKLQQFLPDVLISDIGMPHQDGHDLLRKVRALDKTRGGLTPAIALTGYARAEDRASMWQAGYQAVTPKPVNLTELLSTITELAARPVHPPSV